MAEEIAADYLVVGAGAMGLAFVDTMLSDTKDTKIIIVDRYDRPGGHWTTAYPFVRLHQPSAFYGVNSRNLGENKIDKVGLNKGLAELATVDEICGYYNIVMHQTFLASGRVKYFPKHEFDTAQLQWRSSVTGKTYKLQRSTTVVDATYMKVKVPSMAPPSYEVAGVELVTPNALPKASRPYGGYTVVGAGKTGIDACLWILNQGIDPKQITWIMPRDSWYFERGGLQPGPEFAASTANSINDINGSVMQATSPEDLMLRLESCQQVIRLTDKVWPTMFRCATVSLAELEQIQRIENIVRQGRVARIDSSGVHFENGSSHKAVPDTIYIDCTADALAKLDPKPIFDAETKTLTLQSVRFCQQVFSAAFIAHVEATYTNDLNLKNELCRVIPHPNEWIDYMIVNLQTHRNGLTWASHPKTAEWLAQARLDWYGTFLPKAPEDPIQAREFYSAVGAQIQGLCGKLEELLGQLPEKDAARAKAQIAGM